MRLLTATVAVGALLLAGCGQGDDGSASPEPSESAPSATATATATATGSTTPPATTEAPTGPPRVVEEVATGLEAPWGLDFLPDGSALVTERDTRRVLLVDGAPGHRVTEVGTIDAAAPQGEAGLLGVAVSPTFAQDALVYLYVSTSSDNRVVRATLDDGRLGTPEPVLTDIPNGFIHDGGRLEFGPDGYLYVSTGETGTPELAQQRDNLAGKVLRITPDGDPAPGNPFGTAVWSWGHRNVQGLAFDDAGQLWASEFGQDTFDELNRIDAGANYGWPEFEGDGGSGDGFVDPQQTWSTDDASPSGLAYLDGYLWMAALKGERLWRVRVDGRRAVEPKGFFVGDHGRVRTVVTAPDGGLWVMTSNRDSRGTPREGDDKILLVQPS